MKITSYRQFWPYYLTQHQNSVCRALHVLGAGIGIAGTLAAIAMGRPGILLAGVVLAYASAWTGHFVFEGNRPATWKYPLWSFVSEFRLVFHLLTRTPLP